MNRRVLLIAYYFPPLGLSGVQRVAKFAKYLPDFGWDVTVLTVKAASYFARDTSLLSDVDRPGISIYRTRSIDPTRMLPKKTVGLPGETSRRLFSRMSQTLLQPDNKIGWYPFALRKGKQILQNSQHEVIFSSAPPYTGHLIGANLARFFDLPLVLDYRDDWIENPRHHYPTAAIKRKAVDQEQHVFSAADGVVTINSIIAQKISARSGDRFSPTVVPHGFDPEDFVDEVVPDSLKMNLYYGGIFYGAQQPDTFLQGLAAFLKAHVEHRKHIVATFVGHIPESGRRLIDALNLGDVVDIKGYLDHVDAVRELRKADVLWMTVGHQAGEEGISTGKLYEYIGSRKPILGLVPEGVAAETLREYKASTVVDPDDVTGTAGAIETYYSHWKSGALRKPPESFVTRFSRKRLAAELGNVLSEAILTHHE